MSAIFEVLDELKEFESNGATQFEELARTIHRGEKPEAAKVVNVLRLVGKSKNDLQNAVWLLEKQAELRQTIAQGDWAEKRNAELREMVNAENAKLELAVQQHHVATFPLQREIEANKVCFNERAAAKQEWLSSVKPKLLKAGLDPGTVE